MRVPKAMFAYPGRRAFPLFALPLVVMGCDSSPFAGSAQTVDTAQAAVPAEALRAAAGDPDVKALYEAAGWRALWTEQAERDLREAIGGATAHALDPGLFLDDSQAPDPAAHDVRLTRAALSYARALARGHLDPERLFEVYTLDRPEPDLNGPLLAALAENRLAAFFDSLPPQTREYRMLSEAFRAYLARSQAPQPRAIAAGKAIHPGDRDPRIPRIAETLAANGYLPGGAAAGSDGQSVAYTPRMAAAVRRMQADYGVESDGVIGSDTLGLLNIGARDRARQLAVALERLRWLDREPAATRIDVNTAAATLTYYRDGQVRDRRRVVVGEPGWETPQLGSPIYRLVANPTWTVPRSIEEEELAAKGEAYLRENNMERRDGWIVQRPGDDNALGRVKFDMLNDQAIYLHDTPHKTAFALNERHRSHGCVRVHDALGFAALLSQDAGVRSAVADALPTLEESFVKLPEPIPVRLIYQTVFVDGDRIAFRADPYGWDETVARALGRESQARRTVRRHRPGGDIGP